jgi:hypothetical protein
MDKDKVLIPRPSTALTSSPTTSNRVIRRMTEGLLAQARQTQLQQARFRIGDYELREPDYKQICLWAEELTMAPDELLIVLADSTLKSEDKKSFEPIEFSLVDGTLHSLVWDFSRLPVFPDSWVNDLCLHTLGFTADPTWHGADVSLAPKAPRLRRLHCSFRQKKNFPLCSLKLEGVPQLSELKCCRTFLTKLDLSPVPGLTELGCADNKLTELDLTPVPRLTELTCGVNQLTELDLTPVPGLTELTCGVNQLTELDLTPVSGLTGLWCAVNQLTELDLTPVSGLTKLWCDKEVKVRNASANLTIVRW